MFSINVLVVTYNHENVLGRALDSILCQKEYGLKNIIIGEDCSPDGTWNIVQKYAKQYPDIIKPYHNEHNMGIYPNLEKLVSLRGDADMYYVLAGDDELIDGYFKTVQEYLCNNKIEIDKEAAVIFSDHKNIRPNGLHYTFKNNRLVKREKDIMSLKIRQIVSMRSTLVTKLTYDRFEPLILDEGLGVAEEQFDSRPIVHADKYYYVPFVASIYYSMIGISTKLEASGEKYYNDRIHQYKRIKELRHLNKTSVCWLDFEIGRCNYYIEPNLSNYCRLFKLYFHTLDGYSKYCFKRHVWMLIKLTIILFKQ